MNPYTSKKDELFGVRMSEISRLIDKDMHEKHMRNTSPAVKEAWEKYQTVLKLAGHK